MASEVLWFAVFDYLSKREESLGIKHGLKKLLW